MSHHHLHIEVANCINQLVKAKVPKLSLELDPACLGNKHLPFFLNTEVRYNTKITNVDLIIMGSDDKVRLICEIEETDIKPNKIFGKVFVAAAAKMYRMNKTKYEMSEKGVFIQVLSKKGLKEKSQKIEQGKNIKESINTALAFDGFWIKEYHLIYGDVGDFQQGGAGYTEIEDIINKL